MFDERARNEGKGGVNGRPTHLDLFSGIGGFSLAFEWAGFRTIGFVEFNDTKRIVLREWWPGYPLYGDIREFSGADFRAAHGRPNVVTGGVPCQPASALGRMRGTADERWMWPEAIRVVRETRPDYFIFENPPSLLSLESGRAWNGIVSGLAALGYDLWWDVFPAAAFGAGHLRERVLLIGSNADDIHWGRRAGRKNREEVSHGSLKEIASDADLQRRPKAGERLLVREQGGFAIRAESPANDSSAPLADPNNARLQGHAKHEASNGWRPERAGRPITPPDLRGRVFGDNWWHEAHTGVPVLVDGLPNRLVEAASLCAGDSIVPQVVYPFAKAIYEELNKD